LKATSRRYERHETRSRAAIERLGATFERVRRAHKQAADGGIRDSASSSILRAEWPAVRTTLTERLAHDRAQGGRT